MYENDFFFQDQNSTNGSVAPAKAKVTGATIRTWLLNKFISFLAVLGWKSDKLKTRIIQKADAHPQTMEKTCPKFLKRLV